MREGVKMRRCEDEKMFYRPPLLEEPCAQTLSGITIDQCQQDTPFKMLKNQQQKLLKKQKNQSKSINLSM